MTIQNGGENMTAHNGQARVSVRPPLYEAFVRSLTSYPVLTSQPEKLNVL